MKTKLGLLLLITFIAISIIIVYKEASARPPLCDYCEWYCSACNGTFYLGPCWDYSGLTYCLATCQNCDLGCLCGTTDCVF